MSKILRVSASAGRLVSIILLLLAPLTMYDLFRSASEGVVTYSFLYIPVGLLAGFLLSQAISSAPLISRFETVFFPVSVMSFVLYCIVFAYPEITYSLPEYTFGDYTHRTALFLNVLMGPEPIPRNAGIASEPGVYQLLVNMALYARIEEKGKVDQRSIFYSILVLSTVSTAGIAIMAVILTFKLRPLYRFVAVLSAIMSWSIIEKLVIRHWEAKIANDFAFFGRVEPALNAARLFIEKPFGIGAVEYTQMYEVLDIGSFDSFTQVAMRYGLFGLIALFTLIWAVWLRKPTLAIVFSMTFLTNPIWFVPVIAAFYFPQAGSRQSRLFSRTSAAPSSAPLEKPVQ